MATSHEALKQGEKKNEERDEYGGYEEERYPRYSQYRKLKVVPCEIEMTYELYQLITETLIMNSSDRLALGDFINCRFTERMKQILTDPQEFGKLFLDDIKRNHSIHQDCDITGD